MPVLYSIHGRGATYDEIQAPSRIASADLDFGNMLFSHLTGQGGVGNSLRAGGNAAGIQRKMPTMINRGYGEESKQPGAQRTRVLLARDLMTRNPKCILGDDLLERARDLMREHGFRHVPVMNPDRTLVGMLSDRDLLRVGAQALKESVQRHMAVRVLSATGETPIREVASEMLDNRVHAIPIIDSGHRIVGILTSTDLLRAIVRHAPVDLWT